LPYSQPLRSLFPCSSPTCRRARKPYWRRRRQRSVHSEHSLFTGTTAAPTKSARHGRGVYDTAPRSPVTCTDNRGKYCSLSRRPALADAPAASTVVPGSGGPATPAVVPAAAAARPVRTDAVKSKTAGVARASRASTACANKMPRGRDSVLAPASAEWGGSAAVIPAPAALSPRAAQCIAVVERRTKALPSGGQRGIAVDCAVAPAPCPKAEIGEGGEGGVHAHWQQPTAGLA